MTRISKILRWATAAATLLLMGALAVQCILILAGGAFTRELVAGRLRPLILPAILWALLALTAWLTGQSQAETLRAKRPEVSQKRAAPRFAGPLRIALYAVAIALVALGVMNGGLRDVLVKAINICTECIGLG